MAKSQKELLDTIGDYIERLQVLVNHTGKNYLLANKDELSYLDLLPLHDLEHWNFIKEEIIIAFSENNYNVALDMTAKALLHLYSKTKWQFAEDDSRVFSNKAQLHHFGVKIPIAATFFADSAKSAQKAGMAKTESRLYDIDAWLANLEHHHKINFDDQALEALDTVKETLDNATSKVLAVAEETYNKVSNFFNN